MNMKRLISAVSTLVICSGMICLTTGSTNTLDDLRNVTREDAGALLNENFYSYVNFERFREDSIPYNKMYNFADTDWTEDALAGELADIISSKASHPYGSNEQRIADLYEQYTDTEKRDSDGISALEPFIERIGNAKNIDELVKISCELTAETGVGTIFPMRVDTGLTDSSRYIFDRSQMAMPVEPVDFFRVSGLADDLQKTVRRVIEYLGGEDSRSRARNTVDILMTIAEHSRDMSELLNDPKSFTEMPLEEINALFTADISPYTDLVRSHGYDSLLILNADEMRKTAELLTDENLQAWKDYMTTQLLCIYCEYLPSDAALVLSPIKGAPKKLTPKFASDLVITEMGKEFDFIFASEYGDDERIEAAREFAAEIISAYGDMIADSSEIDDATRAGFLRKLEKCEVQIDIPREPYDGGYDWIPASQGGSLLANIISKKSAGVKKQYDLVGTPCDRSVYQWDSMPSYTYNNACYHQANYVTIPFATICDSFFSPDADRAYNLGHLGFTLCHELSHAFDSNSLSFDDNGNYRPDWISDEYSRVLERKKADITEIYNEQRLFGIYPLDGALTLGENMADIGGVQCIISMGRDTDEKRRIFEEYAKAWYMLVFDTEIYGMLYEDEHSANEFRVNVVLSQMDEFYDAYNITDGAMYTAPEDRRRIW